MEAIVRNAIARIDVTQGNRKVSRGTGFLVGNSLVLTALHVIGSRDRTPPALYPGDIVLTFRNHATRAFLYEQQGQPLWDGAADWALLRCEVPPPAVVPLALGELRDSGRKWESYGFPDANPRDGLVQVGSVTNHIGTLDGAPVFQLFSQEAAAGTGAPVKGASGSPVIVQGRVVGHLRFALMQDQKTVAGTVYACPIQCVVDAVEKASPGLLPKPIPIKPQREQKYTSTLDQRNRAAMLERVRHDWIDGVLEQSLYKIARIELGLQALTQAVEQPLNAIVQIPEQAPSAIPAGTRMIDVFDEHDGALLILGAPGTGKTTLLLELVRELLDRAEQDDGYPIPVVLNLSSWAVKRHPLEQWLVAELNERYDVPKRLGHRWVEGEQILPLLDGLDEVAAEYRVGCLEAINNFRRDHGLLPIAVSSRIADYEALGAKLRLRNALLVQPMTRLQIQNYLAQVGEPLIDLHAAFEREPSLWELLETPLMLWVAMLAYKDSPPEMLATDTTEQQQRKLFAGYVEAMFKRRSARKPYTDQQTTRWLSWLASALIRNHLTMFYLEDISQIVPRKLKLVTIMATALIVGLIGATIGGLMHGLIVGLIGGLIAAVCLTFLDIRPVEAFGWTDIRLRMPGAVRTGLRAGLLFGLSFGLIFGLSNRLSDGLIVGPGLIAGLLFGLSNRSNGLIVGSVSGLGGGLIAGLLFGLSKLIAVETVENRKSANQGTRRSIKAAVGVLFVVWLISGLYYELWVKLMLKQILGHYELMVKLMLRPTLGSSELFVGLITGLIFGLIAALPVGGLFVVKHFAVRCLLCLHKFAPFRYVSFLDYAAERVLLRKVGGGYIFTHRILMEYFASLQE